ncbi:MAG: A24 family peptidase [Candidatus Pacearchaeota archaeon]
MNYEHFFVLLIPLFFLIIALKKDLEKREIPNWIPLMILIITSIIQIAVHNPIEALSGLILLFSVSLILYRQNSYYGGDHKIIAALGPAVFFSRNTIPNFLNFAEFFGIFLFIGIAYYMYNKNLKKVAFMPVIFLSYLAFVILNSIIHFL